MNIYIGGPVEYDDYSAMQGPCAEGFHIPLSSEWSGLGTIMSGFGFTTGDNWGTYLHIPIAGQRNFNSSATVRYQGSIGYYWSSQQYGDTTKSSCISLFASSFNVNNNEYRALGMSIRGFKDTFVVPTSGWTVITGTLGSAGIFWNTTDGIISITSDGATGYTISDKNLGATTVYNSGDTLSQANCGYYYQWGNNYGFAWTGSVTTSSGQVNASPYGPGNYYSSSTFMCRPSDGIWDSSNNANLRGGVTGVQQKTKSVEVKNIYIGDVRIYKGEYIEYKMNADSSGNLYVPVGGMDTNFGYTCPYSWKVSVDGGAETTYSGTGSSGGSITLSGYTAGSSHTIKITPTTEDYQWARAYGWNSTAGRTYITEIIYDASYMGYAVSATDTGKSFRQQQYRGCTSITKAPDEYLPNTVTTIGSNFRRYQYYQCTALTESPEEVQPSSVTSISFNFRGSQYQGCTALTNIKGWYETIGSEGYRVFQYDGCTANKTIKVLTNVGYNSYDQDTLNNSYVTSVSVPSAYLNNFKNSSNYPWVGITDSKFVGY